MSFFKTISAMAVSGQNATLNSGARMASKCSPAINMKSSQKVLAHSILIFALSEIFGRCKAVNRAQLHRVWHTIIVTTLIPVLMACSNIGSSSVRSANAGYIRPPEPIPTGIFGYIPPPPPTTALTELQQAFALCLASGQTDACVQEAYEDVRKALGIKQAPKGSVIVREISDDR